MKLAKKTKTVDKRTGSHNDVSSTMGLLEEVLDGFAPAQKASAFCGKATKIEESGLDNLA
jgi:hypothetical protein